MRKAKILLLTLLFLTCIPKVRAQNLLKYETRLISFSHSESEVFLNTGRFILNKSNSLYPYVQVLGYEYISLAPYNSNYSFKGTISYFDAIRHISDTLNGDGWSLKSLLNISNTILLIFERSTSYREEELYKLLNELNTKIDTTTKNYIEKAKTEINQNVLEYLKGIPDEVLAKSFKEQLLKNLSLEIDEKLRKMKEEMLLELKKP